jgi:hypothetical protein
VCGVCSDDCSGDSACAEGTVCSPRTSALVIDACGADSEHGLCAPRSSVSEADAAMQDARVAPNDARDASDDAETVILDAEAQDAASDAETIELVQTIDGPLTCRESYLRLQAGIEALRLENAACEIDADCTCTEVVHACGSDCSAVVSDDGVDAFQAGLEVLSDGYCSAEGRPAVCGIYDDDCGGCTGRCEQNLCQWGGAAP